MRCDWPLTSSASQTLSSRTMTRGCEDYPLVPSLRWQPLTGPERSGENGSAAPTGLPGGPAAAERETAANALPWPGHDPYATVLQKAEPGHLDMVISRGRVLLDGGWIVTVDEARVTQKLQSLYAAIWEEAGRKTAGAGQGAGTVFFPVFPALAGAAHASRW